MEVKRMQLMLVGHLTFYICHVVTARISYSYFNSRKVNSNSNVVAYLLPTPTVSDFRCSKNFNLRTDLQMNHSVQNVTWINWFKMTTCQHSMQRLAIPIFLSTSTVIDLRPVVFIITESCKNNTNGPSQFTPNITSILQKTRFIRCEKTAWYAPAGIMQL